MAGVGIYAAHAPGGFRMSGRNLPIPYVTPWINRAFSGVVSGVAATGGITVAVSVYNLVF